MNDNTLMNKRSMFSGGRDYSVDVMRSISCLMVIGVHTTAGLAGYFPLGEDGIASDTWLGLTFIQCLTVSATNLFLMISGIFFLSPERNVTPAKLWSKNILKLAVAYCVWSVIYALLRIYYLFPRPFTWELFFDEAITQEVHLWYIPMMLGIYMLVPLLRVFSKHAERVHYLYLIGLMIGAMVLVTIRAFNGYYEYPNSSAITTIIGFTPVDMICQWPVYCILGYFLYTYPPKLKTRLWLYLLGIAGVVFMFLTTWFLYLETGLPNPADVQGKFSIGILARNTGLFVFVITLFSKVKFGKIAKVIVSKISAATLFIYLYHIVSLRILTKEEAFFTDGLPTVKTILLYIGITYVIGFLLSLVFLQLIPWVRMRNAVLDAVWPNRKIWNGGRKKKKDNTIKNDLADKKEKLENEKEKIETDSR